MFSNSRNRHNIVKRIAVLALSVLMLLCGIPNMMSYAAADSSVNVEISFNEGNSCKPGGSISGTVTLTNTDKKNDIKASLGASLEGISGEVMFDPDSFTISRNNGSRDVGFTITIPSDSPYTDKATFDLNVIQGKDKIVGSGSATIAVKGKEVYITEGTEKGSKEDKNTKVAEVAAPAKQMLQANPLKAADTSSVDIAYRDNKSETYYVTAYIGTDKSSYKPGDTVTVTMILANTDPDKDVSDKDTMQYLEFSFYEGDTLIEVENNPFSFGKVKLGKDSELSHTFTYTIPKNAADEETELKMKMTVSSTAGNKFKWGDFTGTGNTECSTPLIIKAPKSVYVESASNNGSSFTPNEDGTLNVAFDLKNYQPQPENRNFTYSLKVEAAEKMGGAKTDITSGLDGTFAWTDMPGIASETETTASGSGTMPAANNGPAEKQAAVQTTLSNDQYGSYNAFYVTLTLKDTTTGETSAQTAVVPRFKLDLSNYTFNFRDDTAGKSIPNYVSKTGLDWLDTLYYGLVAADDDVPFNNAQEFKTFLESQPDEETANSVLQKYIYDLYEPHVGVSGNYGDTNLNWPKDGKSPFHVQPVSKIDKMGTYTLADAGIDYGDEYFKNSNKTATVSEEAGAGDRAYQLDLKTETDPRPINPSVYVIMVPTMWQMFDEAHATAQKGGKTVVGSILTKVDEMAYLYDIKHALIRFAEYLKEKGSNAGVAIVNTQHGGDYSMVQGKNGSGYFTTDMDQLIQAIEGWDAYGDCEHVHWSQDQLNNAMASIPNTFANWKDADDKPVSIDSVVKNMIVIAGPTENSNGTNGYGSKLTEGKYGNVDYVWGIRTDTGTTQVSINDRKIYSWLDTEANQNTIKANNKYYTKIDDPNNPAYQICTSEDAIYNQLVNIFSYDKSATTTVKGTVENVTLEDIVTNEFSVESAVVTVTYLDDKGEPTGVVDTITMTDTSKGEIILEENQDGTTTVKGVVNKIEGRAVVDMKINIKAKNDFVGSNNVKTNSGTPKVSYEHGDDSYDEEFEGDPVVNVPIKISIVNGLTKTVHPGDETNLKDLAYTTDEKEKTITKQAETDAQKYTQTNGKLTYVWTDSDGNEMGTYEVKVENGVIVEVPKIPDAMYTASEADIGKTLDFTLTLTFDPDPITEDNPFSAVEAGKSTGQVHIEVIEWVYELPSSGGIGMYPIMLIGSMLASLGLANVYRRRRDQRAA